jgi:hypothetical protein
VLVGAAEADVCSRHDERGPAGLRQRLLHGRGRHLVVVAVDALDVPAISFEPSLHVFGKREIGPSSDRDVVVVVNQVEFPQLEVTGERGRFRGDAFHHVAIGTETPRAVIDRRVTTPIVPRCQVALCQRHAHGIGHPLPQRTRSGLHARGVSEFGVTRCAASPLAILLQFVER